MKLIYPNDKVETKTRKGVLYVMCLVVKDLNDNKTYVVDFPEWCSNLGRYEVINNQVYVAAD